MSETTHKRAVLTAPYTVYLALHDVDVTLPPGTEFTLYVRVRGNCIGVFDHPEFGELLVETSEAMERR